MLGLVVIFVLEGGVEMSNRGGKGSLVVSSGSVVASTVLGTVAVFAMVETALISTRVL